MLGIAIRIAQRMGTHSETANCAYGTLEAEMRRRLWWSLILFDARIGELADGKTATLLPTWDCRTPLNVNDSELRAEMKVPPANQSRPTEALFAVVRSVMGEFIRHTNFHLDFTNPALKPIDKTKQYNSSSEKSEILELEQLAQEKYLRFCDEENPLHFMTIWTVRGYLARYRLVEFYSQCSTEAAHPTEARRDAALGDLDFRISHHRKDEFGALFDGFNLLTNAVQERLEYAESRPAGRPEAVDATRIGPAPTAPPGDAVFGRRSA